MRLPGKFDESTEPQLAGIGVDFVSKVPQHYLWPDLFHYWIPSTLKIVMFASIFFLHSIWVNIDTREHKKAPKSPPTPSKTQDEEGLKEKQEEYKQPPRNIWSLIYLEHNFNNFLKYWKSAYFWFCPKHCWQQNISQRMFYTQMTRRVFCIISNKEC